MFEDFKNLNIQGGCFDNPVSLELFKGSDPLSIVYGRNGSGKTTIASCVKQLSEVEEEREKRLQRIADGEEPSFIVSANCVIPDESKKSVFVFNEDFLRDNVRVEKNGLNTIVMLGEQVELDEQIRGKKDQLRITKEEYRLQEEQVNKYTNAEDIISPLFYWARIREGLRSEDGWAEIDRKIKGNKVMSRVNDDVVIVLTGMEDPAESYEHLREHLMADLSLYLRSENAQPIIWGLEEEWIPEDLDELKELLQRPLDTPELSEREQRLVTMLALHPHHSTQETKQMLEEGWPFCPTCLREIDNEGRAFITQTLTNILNKEADEYEGLLMNALSKLGPIKTSLPVFPDHLNEKELSVAEKARDEINKLLAMLREKVELRRRNIYEPMQAPFADDIDEKYSNARTAWLKALEQVESCLKIFNETVVERDRLYEKVRHENFLLARKQLAVPLLGYKQAVANEIADRERLNALKNKIEELESSIKNLEAQKERTDIALGYINMELQYVFFSDQKVKLVAGDGCYKLMVNGKNVRPKKISVGERNVLGLCYFFAMLFSGKRDDEKYSSEYLIVIDDPVSSFDYGNRLGVMSLLRYQFKNITKGNNNSRILVLSHDLQSVFDLLKIRADLKKGAKDRDKSFLELENQELKPQTIKNEYQKLLTRVYDYACSDHPEEMDESLDLSIGNTMRRMMEAFSSFCYNKPFEAMMRTEGIIDKIPENKQAYYENFMCRLTLNGESHEEEHSYTLNDFTPFFTKDEKQQTAKSVLLFLFYLNEPHINAYLGPEAEATIESWKGQEDGWLSQD